MRESVGRRAVALRWLAVLAWAMWLAVAACEATPLDQLIAGKACSPSGECAKGYVCDTSTNVCVEHLGQGGAGGATVSSSTGPATCDSVTDCPTPENHCETPICVGQLCGTTVVAMGVPSGMDTPNDCKSSICDGEGHAIAVNDRDDLPVAAVCSTPSCDSGVPLSRPDAAGTGCSDSGGSVCDGAGHCVQCLSEADCTGLPPSDECQQRVCTAAGTCEQTFTPNHTPVAAQNAGDCKVRECDGVGAIVEAPLTSDPPDDGNDCTTQSCNADGSVHLADVGSGIGCMAGVCDGSGHCTGCVAPSNCGTDTFCSAWACNSGTCQQVPTAMNTALPAAQQTTGDCQRLVCNGSGSVITVAANTDVPSDDGLQCTDETCAAGSPQHPPADFDTTCNQGGTVCDGSGSCVECNSPGQCANQGGICAHATCSSHACGLADTPADTPAPANSQTVGDCKLLVCDGAGSTHTDDDDDDLPIDGDDCTFDVCTSGVPSHPDAPDGAPCGTNGFCDGAGSCSVKKALGNTCTIDAECDSGHCPSDDGVCCNDVCGDTCEACSTSRTGVSNGMCAPIPVGQDPESECMLLGQSCNGAGACAFLCGQTPTSPGGSCPAACSGGCAGGVCFIDCNGSAACGAAAIVCPDGWACEVQCDDLGACDGATVTCPDAYACSLVCSNGACATTQLTCGTGVCSTQCSGVGSCAGASVGCGQNTCSAACTGGSGEPSLGCGGSCDCAPCN